ncbi:MAG: DUF2238 domain-containing protein [Pseudomonadales bacterium]|nr:DUF2238 domain-containing protein [Pseudomonadales bacterium]MDP6470716.1 DUF2238 domain-containing protein [Pseudomonadales bacterium]MDP6828332.1 DUF2238 domain-containing protein [Pseudomonadales bacterium]MDP6972118.1 DUF2238 domain-containing protein [Pseudomonadales bacterium]
MLFLHGVVLMVGGHYTYAEVPVGFWLQDLFDFSRNHYDRIGHFLWGFVPVIIAREILIRRSPLTREKWLFFLVACVYLSISATYEALEWWTAPIAGGATESFLGTQRDVWDMQWDMFYAVTGAVTALATLGGRRDREPVPLLRQS